MVELICFYLMVFLLFLAAITSATIATISITMTIGITISAVRFPDWLTLVHCVVLTAAYEHEVQTTAPSYENVSA